jgi:hypothetical protein
MNMKRRKFSVAAVLGTMVLMSFCLLCTASAAAQDSSRWRYCKVAHINPAVEYYGKVYSVARTESVSTFKEDTDNFLRYVKDTYDSAGDFIFPGCWTFVTEWDAVSEEEKDGEREQANGFKIVDMNWQR